MGKTTCKLCEVEIEFKVLGDIDQMVDAIPKVAYFIQAHEGHELIYSS